MSSLYQCYTAWVVTYKIGDWNLDIFYPYSCIANLCTLSYEKCRDRGWILMELQALCSGGSRWADERAASSAPVAPMHPSWEMCVLIIWMQLSINMFWIGKKNLEKNPSCPSSGSDPAIMALEGFGDAEPSNTEDWHWLHGCHHGNADLCDGGMGQKRGMCAVFQCLCKGRFLVLRLNSCN